MLIASYCLYQPVNAHIRVPTKLYQPKIFYLGRQNYFEIGSHPSEWDDPKSQYIYAEVKDIYANITHANLNYTINNAKTWHKPINMRLINGIPTNGTWMAKILPTKTKSNYTVNYDASFRDYLNYSVSQYGPYFDNTAYTGNDENITKGKGYEVTTHGEHTKSRPTSMQFTFVVNNIGNTTANMLIKLSGWAPFLRPGDQPNFQIKAGNSTDNILASVGYGGRVYATNTYFATLNPSARGYRISYRSLLS